MAGEIEHKISFLPLISSSTILSQHRVSPRWLLYGLRVRVCSCHSTHLLIQDHWFLEHIDSYTCWPVICYFILYWIYTNASSSLMFAIVHHMNEHCLYKILLKSCFMTLSIMVQERLTFWNTMLILWKGVGWFHHKIVHRGIITPGAFSRTGHFCEKWNFSTHPLGAYYSLR